MYFALKDRDAQIACVCFRTTALKLGLRFPLADGLSVDAVGRVSAYSPRSQYQLVIDDIVPVGRGALYRQFELLKEKLQAEGLFEPQRKRRIPAFISRVAIVTSRDGAALQDFKTACRRRGAHVAITLVHAAVQGEAAPKEIVWALGVAGSLPVDVVVVARGGGSIEDLWAFNTEMVARAIAACPKPVISAIGHETDFTIADFVSDFRAATPTAAAEAVARERDALLASIGAAQQRLQRAMLRLLRASADQEVRSSEALHRALQSLLSAGAQRVDDIGAHLERCNPIRRLSDLERRWTSAAARLWAARDRCLNAGVRRFEQADRHLHAAAGRRLTELRSDLTLATAKLEALAPQQTLKRGYAIVYGPRQQVVTSYTQVRPQDGLRIALREGQIDATVKVGKEQHDKDTAQAV